MPKRSGHQIRPLTPTIGATIEGLDVSQTVDETTIAAIRAALLAHQVLFFTDQDLSPARLRDFAARFGSLYSSSEEPRGASNLPEVAIISQHAAAAAGQREIWHADVSYIETPPLGSMLYVKEASDSGGDAAWASMTAAFGALSKPLQDFLTKLEAEHDVLSGTIRRRATTKTEGKQNSLTAREQPPVYHPVVRLHPETGSPSLFVNDLYTSRIVGLLPEESDLVLRHLIHHIQRPEFTVRWQWKRGHLAFWDNRCTQHRTLGTVGTRTLYLAALIGDRPRPVVGTRQAQMTKSGT